MFRRGHGLLAYTAELWMWATSKRPPIGALAVVTIQWTLHCVALDVANIKAAFFRGALFMANMTVALFKGGTV